MQQIYRLLKSYVYHITQNYVTLIQTIADLKPVEPSWVRVSYRVEPSWVGVVLLNMKNGGNSFADITSLYDASCFITS